MQLTISAVRQVTQKRLLFIFPATLSPSSSLLLQCILDETLQISVNDLITLSRLVFE